MSGHPTAAPHVLADYEMFPFTAGPWTRPVYRRGSGPAVIVIHELPGLNPLVVRFADRVAAAGMTVFCPSLFGMPGRPFSKAYAWTEIVQTMCVRREFLLWAEDRSSPIVEWLKALARFAFATSGGHGVGAVGMCLTGGFALAMMTEPLVVAPVMAQPSLPLSGKKRDAALGLSKVATAAIQERLETEDLSILGLRFHNDPLVPAARFETCRRLFGARFEAIELDGADAAPAPLPPHGVLTMHLAEDGPTRQAEQRVIEFFASRTGARRHTGATCPAEPPV